MLKAHLPTLWPCVCALTCLAWLGGCSSIRRVDSDYGPGMKLCGLGPTFAWRPGFEPVPFDSRAPYFEPRDYLRRTIECEFAQRGFILAGPEPADFWIDYSFCTNLQGDPYDLFIQYEEGILVLRVFDAQSRHLIWRGWAESRIDEAATPKRRRESIQEAVDKILDRFPYCPRYVTEMTGEIVGQEVIVETEPLSPTTEPAPYPQVMPPDVELPAP